MLLKKRIISVLVFMTMVFTCCFSLSLFNASATDISLDGIGQGQKVLVAAQTGDYTLGSGDKTLEKIANQAVARGDGYFQYKTNAQLTAKGIDLSDKLSTGGAFISSVHTGFNVHRNANVLHFAQSVNVNNIENLYIHAYVNFTNVSGKDYNVNGVNGVWIYGYGQTGEDLGATGYKIPGTVTQGEWVTLTLTKEQALRLVGDDGILSGIQVGYVGFQGAGNGGTANEEKTYFLIDYISCSGIKTTLDSDLTLLTAGESGLYTVGSSDYTLTKVANQSAGSSSGGYIKYKTNAELTAKGIDLSDKLSGSGAFMASVHTGFPTFFNINTLRFTQSVNVNNIENLYIHAYVNLTKDSGNTYNVSGVNGAWIYGLGQTGADLAETGYKIPGDVTQGKWITLTLTKEQALRLVGDDGILSGIQVGFNGFYGAGNGGTANNEQTYFLIDYIACQECEYSEEWTIDVAAGCETAGEKSHHCIHDGCDNRTDITVIPATGHTYGSWIEEVPATCTTDGTLGHYHCSACGKDFDAEYAELNDLTIPTTAHTYGAWIEEVPAQIGVAGTLGHYHCSVCGKDFDAEYAELDSLVITALDGIKYASLSLNGDIGVNFYVYVGGASSLTANSGAITSVKHKVQGVEYFKFTINVAAQDYKKDITIEIDGTDIKATYKVESYINAIDAESNAYDLVQSLKTYCEAARVFFAKETPSAADDVSISSSHAAGVTGADEDVTLVGATLILETKTTINVYFKVASLVGKTFTVNGNAVVPVAVAGNANLYMISIENIAAVDLGTKYTVKVGGYTVTYSALSYAYAVINNADSDVAIANVAKALYNYNVQANAYAALQDS